MDIIDTNVSSILNFDAFVNDKGVTIETPTESTTEKKKRGRPKKSESTEIVPVAEPSQKELTLYESNVPYITSYDETTNMLRNSINQIDSMNYQLMDEMNKVKDSKTLRNKYGYICDMTGTAANLISTKVTAIREINKTITDCHNLEMKRTKDLKLTENSMDDDKYIMDMYNAFINAPVGGNQYAQLGPNQQMLNAIPFSGLVQGDASELDTGYNSYMANMTPEQRKMTIEGNPNIKTHVIYDQSTGAMWFDVLDITTGQKVDGVPVPDQMLLNNITLDTYNNIAKDKNLDITYPLVTINGNSAALEY